MRKIHLVGLAALGLALAAGLGLFRDATAADDDAAGVRKRCSLFVDAWNAHDAKAMAGAFLEDGDMIGPMGNPAAGRAAVEKAFAAEHGTTGPMRESKLEIKDEPIRFVTSDVAISDAEVVVSGVVGPDGSKNSVNLHVTNVWKKTGGDWYIFASRPYIRSAPGAAK